MYTKVIAAIEALAALAMIGAAKVWAPVCAGMITLENGNQVHMKCHYAGQAVVLLAAVILVAAIVAFLAKKDHKIVQLVVIAASVAIFVVFTDCMGICMMPDMACHGTALWARVLAGVAAVAALADMVLGKEGQVPA